MHTKSLFDTTSNNQNYLKIILRRLAALTKKLQNFEDVLEEEEEEEEEKFSFGP